MAAALNAKASPAAHLSPKRALIVKLGAIGDVIMAVPAVYELHRQGYAIDWICGPAVYELLSCYSWIRTIPADDRTVLHGTPPARLRALLALWGTLRKQRYDLCATLYYDRRWRLLTLPVRADRHLTLSRTDRARRILPTRHHTGEFARILLDWPDTCRDSSLPPLRPDLLPQSPLPQPSTSKRIAIVPGGASNTLRRQILRRWPLDRYRTIATALIERGHEVVLLGGSDDLWVRDAFVSLANHPRLLDAIGTLSLPQVIAVADACDLILTHDTGPLHLAGLSRAPLLALFGPTDPGSFLPRRPGVRVLWGGEGFSCRPCYDGRNFAPCADNGCMQSISVASVLQQIDTLLDASSQAPQPFPQYGGARA